MLGYASGVIFHNVGASEFSSSVVRDTEDLVFTHTCNGSSNPKDLLQLHCVSLIMTPGTYSTNVDLHPRAGIGDLYLLARKNKRRISGLNFELIVAQNGSPPAHCDVRLHFARESQMAAQACEEDQYWTRTGVSGLSQATTHENTSCERPIQDAPRA